MKLRALVVGMGLLCSFSSFAATELRYGLEAEYPPFESRNASSPNSVAKALISPSPSIAFPPSWWAKPVLR